MPTVAKTKCWSAALLSVLFFFACSNNKTESATDTQVKSTSAGNETTNPTSNPTTAPATKAEDGQAIATITAPHYVAKVHQAIAFVPGSESHLIKVKPGHQFVVLDMSVRNTSDKPIDMGQILIMLQLKDDKGNKLPLTPAAIAAYMLGHPDPSHKQEYNALWGKMNPGDFHRTIVYGTEVPEGTKNFVISMKEDAGFDSNIKSNEAKFSIQ